jgi:hypothetical protein
MSLIRTQPPPRRGFRVEFSREAEIAYYAVCFTLISFFAGLITGVLLLPLN